MIKKIVLHNFMSHAHSEIELSEGLTVLTGPNNCGKSAIVGALDVLCNNLSGDFMVRHGEKECYISIELNEGDSVTWRRKAGVTSYEINGREVHRLGRGGVPEDLHGILRMPQIQQPGRPGDPFEIHLAHQKSPIFLLDQPGSRAAMFFASSSDAEKLLRMQQLHRQKVRTAKQTLSHQRSQVAELQGRRDTLQSIDGIADLANKTLAEEQKIADLAQAGERASLLLGSLEQALDRRLRAVNEHQCLHGLTEPPTLRSSRSLSDLILQIELAGQRLHWATAMARSLNSLAPPPDIRDTTQVRKFIGNIDAMHRSAEALRAELGALHGFENPPQVTDTKPLLDLIVRIQASADRRESDVCRVDALLPLGLPPQWIDLDVLRSTIAKMNRAVAQVEQADRRTAVLVAVKEPPVPRAASELTRSIEEMQNAHMEVIRSREALDHLDQLIADMRDRLSWKQDRSDSGDAGSRGRTGLLVIAAILAVVAGAGIWASRTALPWVSSIGERLKEPSDQVVDVSETPLTPPTTWLIVGDQAEGAGPPLERRQSLESERAHLLMEVRDLETAIEKSRADLQRVRERLAVVERALTVMNTTDETTSEDKP